MTIEADLLETLNQMPDSLKQEVLHYAKYLNEKYSYGLAEDLQTEVQLAKDHLVSLMKGTFNLPLPDQYDASTNLTSEQKESLEKRYGYGSLAGKIIMSDDFDEPLEDLKDYM